MDLNKNIPVNNALANVLNVHEQVRTEAKKMFDLEKGLYEKMKKKEPELHKELIELKKAKGISSDAYNKKLKEYNDLLKQMALSEELMDLYRVNNLVED